MDRAERPLPRRTLLGAAAASALPWPAVAAALVEPTLRLAPAPDGAPEAALTLDACLGGFDWRLARALADARIPATIFAAGDWIARNPDAAAFLRARADLFAVENHGARHLAPVIGGPGAYGQPSVGSLDGLAREVANGARAVAALTGVEPRWFRGATARYGADAIAAIEAMGSAIAGYSLNADAGASLPAAAVARRVAQARAGDVILGHINQPNRPAGQGLADGVLALRARGIRIVRLPPPG